MSSDKRVVLITGCSDGGLGSRLALAFNKTGKFRVIATARNLNKLKDTRSAGIEDLQLDVLSKDSVDFCVEALEALTGGRLDMLVNNAGAVYSMPAIDVDLDDARAIFDLNVFSLITVSRAFTPLLIRTPKSIIANNISVVAYTNPPVNGVYNASKAAANSITENMRLELKPFGVQVIALLTGGVRSNIEANKSQKAGLPADSIY